VTGSERPDTGGRREELIAAALAGELSDAEAVEFDRLRTTDPSIDEELASFAAVLTSLRGVGRWDESEPSGELSARIREIPEAREAAELPLATPVPLAALPQARRAPQRRRLALALMAAAACVALGAVGGLALQALGDRPIQGEPGTLGAIEPIAFTEDSPLVIDASLIAHTWGTETILRGTGFTIGESYELILVTASGERLLSGSFLGSEAEIDCEMNAAVTRTAVTSIEITDDSGATIAVADLPPVQS
jgi:hypothetical protein